MAFGEPTLSTDNLAQRRASLVKLRGRGGLGSCQSGVVRERFNIPGPKDAPDVGVISYRPESVAAPLAAYLHFHGGGYVSGAADLDDDRLQGLAFSLGIYILSVDYRLAPETPFPGAIEDAYAALAWLHQRSGMLEVNPTRIAIGGSSAGGGLAASLALLARDRAEFPICHQQLVAPMLDDRPVDNPFAGEFIWRREDNAFGWECLLGHTPGGANVSPYAAAARANDLASLPPAFVSIGAIDLFVDHCINYARRLIRAGVPAELHVYPGAYHGFDFVADSKLAKAHAMDQRAALSRALNAPG